MSFDCFGRNRGLCLGVAILLGACALGSRNAFADTNLVNSSSWVIDGTDDTGLNPTNIALTVNGDTVSSFSKLAFSYNVGGSGVVVVCTITGSGAIRLSLPPPGLFGGTFNLATYEDCDLGLLPPMAITELEIRTKKGKKDTLEMKGKLSNFNSMESKDFELTFETPDIDSVSVDVQYSLTATRDICINQTNHAVADDFHAVSMAANYISPSVQENDLARFIRITNKTCFFYGCVVTKKSLCEGLVNTNGFLVNNPRALGNPNIILVHTQPVPTNTPTLMVAFRQPSRSVIKTQGFVNETADPTDQNVTVWGDWVKAKDEYKNKRKIGKFRYTLSVSSPQMFSCDDTK